MNIKLSSLYKYDCYRDGKLIWTEEYPNIVTYEGLDYAMDLIFGDAVSTVADTGGPEWYCGLIKQGSFPIIEDNMSSHVFTEMTEYSAAERRQAEFVKSNTAEYTSTTSQFFITRPAIVIGAFLTTSPNKGGSDGYLYGASTMVDYKTLAEGDALNITIRVQATG